MFNSVALDVVIGLVFIYLLYSLLTTIMSELFATMLGLRARNLKEAIDRMLNDEDTAGKKWKLYLKWFFDTINLLKNPKNPVVNAFYSHPEIKYLGSSGVFKTPSTIKAASFSKAVMNLLFGEGPLTPESIERQVSKLMVFSKNEKNEEKVYEISKETADYIRSLWVDAQGDIEKFKLQLENWFDRTMEHTTEWYKRKIRVVTLIIGFMIAWSFNADTFVIVKHLSTDKEAREQLVSMANAYVESNQYIADTAKINDARVQKEIMDRLDSLLAIKQKVEADITDANSILGLGCRLPSSFVIKRDTTIIPESGVKFVVISAAPPVEAEYLKKKYLKTEKQIIEPVCKDQWSYFFWLFPHHFFGFLITAIAVSLGAPFWFDLLNKLTQLRTSKKETVPEPTVKSTT